MRTAFLLLSLISWTVLPVAAQTGPYFTNVTAETGLDGVTAFRIAVGDLDGDGYPDILVHLEPTHDTGDVLDKQVLYMNEPDGTGGRMFVDRTTGSGIRDNRAGSGTGRHSDAAIFGDVDNDGDLDIFTNVYLHRNYTLNEGTNDLLINDGTGHFSLSPNSTFHTEANWNTPAALFVDYDNDGFLDLYIGTWYNPDSTMNIDRLYRGAGDGSFTDVTAASGISAEVTCVYAVAAFDWNDDGFTDLFAPPYSRSVLWSLPRHWQNNGNGTFTQVQEATQYDEHRGVLGQKVSFGTMPRDYDNDGQIDLLEIMTHGTGSGGTGVHTTTARNVSGVFSWDFANMSGRENEDPDLTHDGDHFGSWFDFNHDMLPDFVVTESGYGNPRLYLFKQAADHSFAADTLDSGLWEVNLTGVDPGYVTPLDYDLDGDEDLLITLDPGVRLYRNDVGTDNHWIAIDLEGVGAAGYSNRSAIGARVEVTTGAVTQTQEVYAGNGHEGPMRPLTLYFGLAGNTVIDSIRVRWPNTALTLQELNGVAADQFLTIREPCDYATDPSGLVLDKSGGDLALSWDDPVAAGMTWNVYRDTGPDRAAWGPAHAVGVTDEDAVTSGIQWTDSGAGGAGSTYYYLVTGVNQCGETGL